MLTNDSEVKVIDFGLAKAITHAGGEMDLTHGEFVGTPTFASPEQFGGGPVMRAPTSTHWVVPLVCADRFAPHPGKTLDEIRDRKTRDGLPVAQLIARKVPEPLVKFCVRRLLLIREKDPHRLAN